MRAYISYLALLVIIIGSWAGCAAPVASPTFVPWPTPTGTPTPVPPVTVGLLGKLDSNGALLEDLEVISGDSLAILHLAEGTRVFDAHRQVVDSITVTAKPAQASGEYIFLSGLAYDFGPAGARVDPPARLTIRYDPALLPLDVDETRPAVATFDGAESAWTRLDVMMDSEAQRVIVDIDHLGTFVVSFDWFAPPVS